jgi:hypothetical protein
MKKSVAIALLTMCAILAILAEVLFPTLPAQAQPAPAQPLKGFADMHTHPMSHLGFGGMIMFGAPDEGSLMLKGQRYRGWRSGADNCWGNGEAGSVEVALGRDAPIHGGHGRGSTTFHDANNCGNHIRQKIVEEVERRYDHPAGSHWRPGYPDFADWPRWSSVTHQQMWWEWIKRSFDGGQRVMVALAVNNSLLTKAADASQFVDDKSSVELQLTEITSFVGRHLDFMEVARTPADLRRIVQSNRMAVILGVETDDFGNLAKRAAFGGERITRTQLDAEIRRLHALGVRYILPIHFSNTPLGGYAIKDPLFAVSSKEYTNSFATPRETCGEGIHFELTQIIFDSISADALRFLNLGWLIDSQPTYTPPAAGCGHKNSLGLTALGREAIHSMMNLGMMIDIDHMSRLAADETLAIAQARNYPINSGHNGLLADNCISGRGSDLQHCNENQRTTAQYEKIRSLGGMVGLGHGGQATNFVREYRKVLELMGNTPVAIGTDVNGLEALPAPDPLAPVRYDASFPMYRFGNRTWNFNVDGFAHYGLFPDYIRSWRSSADPATRMTDRSMDAFMSSAEGFARMWEKSALRAVGAPRTVSVAATTSWCTHAGAILYHGDFNGDGSEDLLCRDPGRLWIDYADNRGSLVGTTDWFLDTRWCTHAGIRFFGLGDFNGDGRTDLLCKDATRIWSNIADSVGRFSTAPGGSFVRDTVWCTHSGITFQGLGDFNGDGRTDLLCKDATRIWINAADSQGRFSSMGSLEQDTVWCAGPSATPRLTDVNGDGRTDLLCRDGRTMRIVYTSASGRFLFP